MKSFIQGLRLFLISLWLGAAIFFSAFVAPAVFGVLRGIGLVDANQVAGTIISHSLRVINLSGFAVAVFLLLTLFGQRGRSRVRFIAEMISLAIMGMMTALGHWVIAARMLALRVSMGAPIDQVARDDSRRVLFDSLHHYSVLMLGVAMLAGLIAWIAAFAGRTRVREERNG